MEKLISKLKKFKKESEKKNALSSLSKKKLSQSESIQLGNRMEILINAYISSKNKYVNGYEKNEKGKKQKDIFFIDNPNKIIYYAELKANIELDTEKAPATIQKMDNIIKNDLIIRENGKYKDWTIKTYLVSLRFLTKKEINLVLKQKYTDRMSKYEEEYIKNNKKWTIDLVGIREILEIMNIDYPMSELDINNNRINYLENEENYKILINKIVDYLIS